VVRATAIAPEPIANSQAMARLHAPNEFFRETALRNLVRMRSEDKDLFVRMRRAVALVR
jgi:hypothetical protein